MQRGSLSDGIPEFLPDELFTPLAVTSAVRIERIVSRGHTTAEGTWYDQDEHEFVLVVAGAARIEIEGRGEVALGPGDWLVFDAHVRHRVSWTDPDVATVWLAVFHPAGTASL